MPCCSSQYPDILQLKVCLHSIVPWLRISLWNFSLYFYSGTWLVSNHLANAQHIVFSRSYFVFSCFICFCSVIVLIFHFLCDNAWQHSIWSLVSNCAQRQQLPWACNFHLCRVVAVVIRSFQIFIDATSTTLIVVVICFWVDQGSKNNLFIDTYRYYELVLYQYKMEL